MKFSLKPCLKSLLYLSNQCCEILQKYIKPKTGGNKVVKNDFTKAVSQDFSKTKKKQKHFFKNRKKIKTV